MQDQQPQNRIKEIRQRMGMTQQEFAEMIGCTQGNVGHYELRDQMVPSDVAKRLIFEAAVRGHRVTYEDVYGVVDAPVIKRRLRADALELSERRARHAED